MPRPLRPMLAMWPSELREIAPLSSAVEDEAGPVDDEVGGGVEVEARGAAMGTANTEGAAEARTARARTAEERILANKWWR